MKILMVCIGNICRSPIAEGILQSLIEAHQLDWVVDSAGTHNYHVGEAPHQSSQKVCKAHRIDISRQKARQFSIQDFEQYDVIYALAGDVFDTLKTRANNTPTRAKLKLLLDEVPDKAGQSVPDPWYGNEAGYLPVYRLIEEACLSIVNKYAS